MFGQSIRSINSILQIAGKAKNVRLAVALENIEKSRLIKIGFGDSPNVGDYLIPGIVGKVTNVNANGSVILRRDLPKITESVMYFATYRDWQGGIHHGIRTRPFEKYVREYTDGPEEKLQIIIVDGKHYVASDELLLEPENSARNIHVANLMLECFSNFEIVDIERNQVVGPKLKRVQWDLLPKGSYPWEKSKGIIGRAINEFSEKDRQVIEHRMREISKRDPDILATGRAGFCGYFVYGFSKRNIYVLESIFLDNATYVFSSDWEALSQLSKSELINGKLPHQRIVHNDKWRVSVGRAIDGL